MSALSHRRSTDEKCGERKQEYQNSIYKLLSSPFYCFTLSFFACSRGQPSGLYEHSSTLFEYRVSLLSARANSSQVRILATKFHSCSVLALRCGDRRSYSRALERILKLVLGQLAFIVGIFI